MRHAITRHRRERHHPRRRHARHHARHRARMWHSRHRARMWHARRKHPRRHRAHHARRRQARWHHPWVTKRHCRARRKRPAWSPRSGRWPTWQPRHHRRQGRCATARPAHPQGLVSLVRLHAFRLGHAKLSPSEGHVLDDHREGLLNLCLGTMDLNEALSVARVSVFTPLNVNVSASALHDLANSLTSPANDFSCLLTQNPDFEGTAPAITTALTSWHRRTPGTRS
mmetsp:Transcript_100231/g.180873  ORF Transcript_100231/g.180873 Transcript_100231/m.180873 type:complete len:226 (-) Transcript_100231:793-1470(-)